MGVQYILEQFGRKTGISKSQTANRDTLVRYLNEAAMELYDQADMVGILMEQVFKVNGDQTISLPYYVGPVRGVREFASMQSWHINRMRPRYNQFNWPDLWRNCRIRNVQALQYSVVNTAVVMAFTPTIENPPVQVTIVGPTDTSSNMSEVLTLDSTCQVSQNPKGFFQLSQNQYNDIVTFKKNVINQYDITLYSVDWEPLTVIPNCLFEARYQILDVSSCPWLAQNTSTLDNYLEILYKKALPVLWNDSDSFPSKTNFDNIIVNKMMQLWKEVQDKPQLAEAYDMKATRSLARKQEDENHSAEDVVALVANPHDTILKRIGTGLRRRYSLYAGRKY